MNPRPPKNFSERLIALQRVDGSLQQKHQTEIDKMFVEPLTSPRKAYLAWRIALSLAIMAIFIHHWMVNRSEPPQTLILDASAVLACGVLAAYLVRVLLRGTIDRRARDRFTARLQEAALLALALIIFLTAAAAPDAIAAVRVLAGGAILLLLGAVFYVQVLIRESRMKLEERNLELQYRIAELSEQIKKPQ